MDQRLTFEQHRGRLWSVAYRMLGSRADADDMVQEAWLRWHGAAHDEVRASEAWLVTTVTRLCIDRLRQLRTEREAYVGPWLPEPLVGEAPPADAATELASDLSVAFLALLERLAPEERAAFLLHDVFDSGYDDIAKILGKSETACRQIVSRARTRVRSERPRVQVDPAAHARLIDAFVGAVQARDQDRLLKLLAADSTWTADGGGKRKAALKVLHGAERIARFIVGVYKPLQRRADVEFRTGIAINGEPGVAVIVGGELFAVWSLRTDGHRILDVYIVMNPEKLRGIDLSQ